MEKIKMIPLAIVLLLRSTLTLGEPQIQIEKLEGKNGYLTINLDDTQIIEKFDLILHTINLKEVNSLINQMELNVEEMFANDDRSAILEKEINDLRHAYATLIPHRYKRGVLDIGGTVMKWLYGTMDTDDRKQIEEHLNIIDQNNHNLIENSNKQIHINNITNRNIQALKESIDQDRLRITKVLDDMNERENSFLKDIYLNQQLIRIRILKDEVDKIQTNVLNIKMGHMIRSVLTNEEIDQYDIDSVKLENIQLALGKFKETLAFIIKIPKTVKNINKYIVTPLTDSSYEELDIETQTVIKYNNKYLQLKDDIYLKNLKPVDPCIRSLFEEPVQCNKRRNSKNTIVELDTGVYLSKNNVNAQMTNTCDNKRYTLNGNYLIKFYNCNVKLNDIELENNLRLFEQYITIPNFGNMSYVNVSLSLEEIQLTQNENINKIEELKYEKGVQVVSSIVAGIVIVLLICVIVKIFIRKHNSLKQRLQIRISQNPEETKLKGES